MTGSEEVTFGTDRVNRIDNSVGGGGEENFGIFFGIESLLNRTACFGIDLEDSFGKNDRLGLPNGVGGSVNLTVGVGETEVVEIDKRELPHAGAGEGLDGPGPNSAESNNHDMGFGESLERNDAVKSGDAAKAIEIVLGHSRTIWPRCGLNKSEDSDNHLNTINDG